MTIILSNRGRAVMAAGTSPGIHVAVIEIDRRPSRRGMADLTLGCGLYMPGGLTDCRRVVVTAVTVSDHLRMIDPRYWGESRHCMTIFADLSRRNVSGWLADRIVVVVATRTISCNIIVVKIRR